MQFLSYKPSLSSCHGLCNITFSVCTKPSSWVMTGQAEMPTAGLSQKSVSIIWKAHFSEINSEIFHIFTYSLSEYTSNKLNDIYHSFHTCMAAIDIIFYGLSTRPLYSCTNTFSDPCAYVCVRHLVLAWGKSSHDKPSDQYGIIICKYKNCHCKIIFGMTNGINFKY